MARPQSQDRRRRPFRAFQQQLTMSKDERRWRRRRRRRRRSLWAMCDSSAMSKPSTFWASSKMGFLSLPEVEEHLAVEIQLWQRREKSFLQEHWDFVHFQRQPKQDSDADRASCLAWSSTDYRDWCEVITHEQKRGTEERSHAQLRALYYFDDIYDSGEYEHSLSMYTRQGSFLSSGPDNYERSQNVRKVSEEQRLVQKMLKMRGMMLHTWIFMLEWTRKKKSTKNFLSMQQYCASMAVQASLCNGKLAHVWKQDKPETRGLSKTVRTPTKKGWKSRMEQVFLLKMRKKFSAVLLGKRMLI